MLLADLYLKAGDKIVISKRGNTEILNLPLLDESTNSLDPRAKEGLRKLFEKFAIASPEVPDELFIGESQFAELSKNVSDRASLRPTSLMAYTSNQASKVYFDDFLNFYELKAGEEPDMVRANLAYVGLRADMRQTPQPEDPDDILNLRSSPYDMPRYKITNDPRTFPILM